MKRNGFILFLVLEAFLCIMLTFFREVLPGAFTTVIAFPFEQIALGLRVLSLSGPFGNGVAIILYAAISLIPAVLLLLTARKRRPFLEDWMLALITVVLFVVLYLMINPGIIQSPVGTGAVKAFLGTIAWSVIATYIILRILRLFFFADTQRLHRYMAFLLHGLAVLFVYCAFGSSFSDFLDSVEALRTGNTGNVDGLWVSMVFLALQYLVNALPYVLNVLVVFAGLRLFSELQADRYSQASVDAAGKLSQRCCQALIIIMVTSVDFNLLQLAFVKRLRVLNTVVQVPILSIAFLLTVLLLSRYIWENKQLKDDNDMFI
ncbi:MAG TPA: hypothetical protein PK369_08515 [Thermoclostridium sp.]|nr:hypothetical protein [Clostridiaceae bacterium]HOQ76592.1 hypothetical protein [Thermoclostridium sp.]